MTRTMSPAPRASLLQRGLLLEYLTVGWNIAEGVIAIGAGLVAGSVALIGFGVDSFVETVSGAILAGRLRSELRGDDDAKRIERVERLAERLVGIAERARHALLHDVPHLSSAIIHADPCGHGGADHHAELEHHGPAASPSR